MEPYALQCVIHDHSTGVMEIISNEYEDHLTHEKYSLRVEKLGELLFKSPTTAFEKRSSFFGMAIVFITLLCNKYKLENDKRFSRTLNYYIHIILPLSENIYQLSVRERYRLMGILKMKTSDFTVDYAYNYVNRISGTELLGYAKQIDDEIAKLTNFELTMKLCD